MTDLRDFLEDLVYRTSGHRRFLQQSPVMPDVWIKYGMKPGVQQDLLMVPNWHYTPAQLARGIKQRLEKQEGVKRLAKFRSPDPSHSHSVAHNQNAVVAHLWFDEMVRAVLPLSTWWRASISDVHSRRDEDHLARGVSDRTAAIKHLVEAWEAPDEDGWLGPDLLWLARVAGLIAYMSSTKSVRDAKEPDVALLSEVVKDHKKLATALVDLLVGIEPVHYGENFPLYNVNLNRQSTPALEDSVAAVKADASNRLFQVSGQGIRWAIIDSGVDATHVAFRKREASGTPKLQPFARPRRRRRGGDTSFINNTRVVASYDFVHVRELLGADPAEIDNLSVERFPALSSEEMRDKLRNFLESYDGGMIDWQAIMPILRVPHTPFAYKPPKNRHGTHVAGILGADWRSTDETQGLTAPGSDLKGVCPEIELYDLRVLGADGSGNEFAIMSAMQFVRALNREKDFVAIHGVNLSLSIPHDVSNYACGRTPVCEEAERLVGSGILVVAAAGNSGRARYLTPSNQIDDGFRTVSITDPGNADGVITVGATHRRDAHTYGVSYFSSRGPTGDGRLKPDLVAPGEKIRSTVPGDRDDRLDGTSMAAPHVSGAAALIMSRNFEMIGQPLRIKHILTSTATDLGRERYFQGAGLLDTLRALQAL